MKGMEAVEIVHETVKVGRTDEKARVRSLLDRIHGTRSTYLT